MTLLQPEVSKTQKTLKLQQVYMFIVEWNTAVSLVFVKNNLVIICNNCDWFEHLSLFVFVHMTLVLLREAVARKV